jgi:SAM-dependent methyltransferase
MMVRPAQSSDSSADRSTTRSTGALVQKAAEDALEGVTTVVTTSLMAGASFLLGTQVVLRAGLWMQPRPMPHQQASLLEHPWRLRYRNPDELLGRLGILAGVTVADIGCGTGLFTANMAERVGESGMVHAIDIQEKMLVHARQRLQIAKLSQRVRFYHSGIHTMPLPDQSVDIALMAAVLGELPARGLALDEVRRILKPGGRLAISEELPDPAYTPAPVARRWAEQAGFRFGALTGTPFCYTLLMFTD